ncbi:MAG: TetR family transcriptional regulator [Oceanococcaceae bacterium]
MNPASATVALSGRERLLSAALRLGARNRSIASLGLRELAREAGMHHTAIYRHFSSIEEVAEGLVGLLSKQLRADLRAARRGASQNLAELIRASTERYFAYIGEHPQGVIFCAREIHGALPALRSALQGLLDDFAADSAADLQGLEIGQALNNDHDLLTLTRLVAHHNLFAALDYLEPDADRERVVERAVRFTQWLVAGALQTAAAPGGFNPGSHPTWARSGAGP